MERSYALYFYIANRRGIEMYEDRKMMAKILASRRIRSDGLVFDAEVEEIQLLVNLNFSIN
jgi:hypothetical protein